MTHDQLLLEISSAYPHNKAIQALYEVVELHKPVEFSPAWKPKCDYCEIFYPCPTIRVIEKELSDD